MSRYCALQRSALSPRQMFVALAIALSAVSSAPGETIKIGAIFPSAAERGTTLEVELIGSIPRWPLRAWCSRADITFEATKSKGRFRVTVDAKAPVGPAWVRFYDDRGASPLKMLLVAPGPRIREKEPNNSLEQAQTLTVPVNVDGRLHRSGEVDTFRVDVPAGQTVVARVVSDRWFDSPSDIVMQYVDSEGNVLAQNDDDRRLDPTLVYRVPNEGRLFLRLFAFPKKPNSSVAFFGSSSSVYQLSVSTSAFIDHTLPMALQAGTKNEVRVVGWNLAPKEQPIAVTASPRSGVSLGDRWHWLSRPEALGVAAIPIVSCDVRTMRTGSNDPLRIDLPIAVSGVFEAAGERHRLSVKLKKGESIRLAVEAERHAMRLDPVIHIVDSSNKILGLLDDSNRQPDIDATWRAPVDGEFRFELSDRFGHAGMRYAYVWRIERVVPAFRLRVDRDVIEVGSGKSTTIDVDVDRIAGFDREIEIVVRGLPESVQCAAATSAPKGASSKKVELEFKAAKVSGAAGSPPNGIVEVVGIAAGDSNGSEEVRAIAGNVPAYAPRSQLWLQVLR